MATRNLGNIEIQFTNGLNFIRECRVMRNNSQYVNTAQVCQPFFDGTYWVVKLFDVVNSQLSTGWWIQVFASFNSASLTYISSVKASNNLVTEYQSTYTIPLVGYNSSRSIPTKLSWLNNKYVANFYEVQYRYLEAVTGQTTQYIKFRFNQVQVCSSSSDILYIYLTGSSAGTPFTPVTSGSNVIAQFLPALNSGDRDFSIGYFAECTLGNSGGYYYSCNLRVGGLTPFADYLVQLSEYNTATSSFYMPTTPGRYQIQFMYDYYPSNSNWQYF